MIYTEYNIQKQPDNAEKTAYTSNKKRMTDHG